MISKSSTFLKKISVFTIINSIVFEISFNITTLLKHIYTSVLIGSQNLLFFLELSKYNTKTSRYTFINQKAFPTTVFCTIIIAAVF